MRGCEIDGCNRPHYGRGWCQLHYRRWYDNGDPCKTQVVHGDDETRFVAYLGERDPDSGCIPWMGYRNDDGYGVARWHGRYVGAHRVAYEREYGPIPPALQIDHLCRRRDCVNGEHLEAVPQRVNIARGEVGRHNREKTHCPYGHPLDGKSGGGRRCNTCHRERERARRERREMV